MQYVLTSIVFATGAFCIKTFLKWYEEAKAAGAVNKEYITKE